MMNGNVGKWSLDNRKIVSLVVFILLLGGIYACFSIPKLEDPEVLVRQALVVGVYPGASAYQVELEVADPLEKKIRETSGVDFTETRCYSDMCIIKVSLQTTVPQEDIMQTWDIMRHKIEATGLPQGATTMTYDDFGDVYGMFYAITGSDYTCNELSAYVDMIRREVQNVEGVSRVSVFGTFKECIRIQMRTDRLANLDVLPVEVIQTLNGQNATIYSGYFQSGGNRIRVSVDDRYRSAEDIAGLIIKGHEKDLIRLGDIADIVLEEDYPVREYMERNGVRAIGLSISPNSGVDIVKVGKRVEKKLDEIRADRLPAGIEINSVFSQPDRVTMAMDDFMLNMIASVVLVILLLTFSMGVRPAMVIGMSLVVIIFGSILFLFYTGGTLQRVSLGALIFSMGMLVDNAIVIADGVLVAKANGVPRMEALTRIGENTGWPLLGATLIVILSFLPIYLSPDVTGIYIHDMFIVLCVSLLLSWILALTHVPIMADRLIYPYPVKSVEKQQSSVLYACLKRTLSFCLSHRCTSVIIVLFLLAGTGYCALYLQRALFPDMEYDQLYMEYKLPENRNYTQVSADLDSISAFLRKNPDITDIVKSVGGTPSRYNLVRSIHAPSLSYGELIVDFKSSKALKNDINRLQEEVSAMFPDSYVKFKRYNLMFMQYPIQLSIMGPDPVVLDSLARKCLDIFNRSGVCSNVIDEWEPDVPAFVIGYNQASARMSGMSRTEVGTSILASTEGLPVGTFYDGTKPMSIYVDCVGSDGEKIKDLNNATVFGLMPDWSKITADKGLLDAVSGLSGSVTGNEPLSQLSDGIRVEWESPVICRYKGERCRSICASPVEGSSVENSRRAVERELENIEIPEGYHIMWGGERLAEDMSMQNLFSNYPLAILLMLVILLALFKDYKSVAVLVLSIPVVFVGAVPAIIISKTTFGFIAVVSILGLVGMILKNGIILIDEIKVQAQTATDLNQALINASVSRMRPVTMAAFTTVLGMIPLLTDSMFKSMAACIIGGLLVGTIIVLLIIPVLYSIFFKKDYENKK